MSDETTGVIIAFCMLTAFSVLVTAITVYNIIEVSCVG